MIKENYTKEHLSKQNQKHLYPTEWVIRTMLGKYPKLKLDQNIYSNAKVLDLGFGDGRNMELLSNIGLDIYGTEITQEIVDIGKNKIVEKGIEATLKVGNNCNIPFDDSYFEIILASSSIYYVNENSTFDEAINECIRVLKPGGLLIANFPERTKSYICQDAIDLGNGHLRITNDVHGLRNGYVFKAYDTEEQIIEEFSELFENISIGYLAENYYGYQLSMFIMTANKKA